MKSEMLSSASVAKMLANIVKKETKNQEGESKALELFVSSVLKTDCTKLEHEELVKRLKKLCDD